MTAEWRFELQRRCQKSREPMQASFFTNASIDDDTHALVREAIQNSLDAKVDPASSDPVYIRFGIGTHEAPNKVIERYISLHAWEHFNAIDNGLSKPPVATDGCRFLVYEDFNTCGLIGDEKAFEEQPKNAFYYFMRAEGKSGKEDGNRGRHGIGKYVFPYTSGIRMFIAATIRSSDGRCLIAGQSVLQSHHVGPQKYTPDGWWGAYEEDETGDYFQVPVESTTLLAQLRNDFGLIRQAHQTGLSVIMPYVQHEVTIDKLSEHVIREYFWPILNGQLRVDICDEQDVRTIDEQTVRKSLNKLVSPEQLVQVSPFINMAVKALSQDDHVAIDLQIPAAPGMPKWDKSYLSKAAAEEIQRALNKPGGVVSIKCPLFVKKERDATATTSHFTILLSKNLSDTTRRPLFIREGITIPEGQVSTIRGYTSIVVIEPGALATLLGDSENPAHTEWEKNATKFKNKYKWGSSTIDFVRLSVGKLLNLLSQDDTEEDIAVLSDIFYLNLPENDEDVPESRKKKKAPLVGPEPEPKPEPDIDPVVRRYRLQKQKNGFVLKEATTPHPPPLRFVVTVAYDFAGASKANAIKQYHKNDFDLAKARSVNAPICTNATDVKVGGNTIEFTTTSEIFALEVTGFDSRRDIIVDVNAEVIREEV